jgi:hypothetical protein
MTFPFVMSPPPIPSLSKKEEKQQQLYYDKKHYKHTSWLEKTFFSSQIWKKKQIYFEVPDDHYFENKLFFWNWKISISMLSQVWSIIAELSSVRC